MKILLAFTHCHAIRNLYDFLSSVENKMLNKPVRPFFSIELFTFIIILNIKNKI